MITISGGSSTSAVNIRSEVVKFLTVLVSDNVSSSGTSISSENNSILHTEFRLTFENLVDEKCIYLEDESNDSSTSLDVVGRGGHASLASESGVSDAVIKVEASFSEGINVA